MIRVQLTNDGGDDDDWAAEVMADLAQDVKAKLAKLRCTSHEGGHLDVRIKFDRHGDVSISISGCCEEFVERAQSVAGDVA